jgi:serine/threonine protein kinase
LVRHSGYTFELLFLPLATFSTAIQYLEDHKKVHRDISYTNILLRESGNDSPAKKAARERLMQKLGLPEIEILREKLKCREGLLIDFDYATNLEETAHGSVTTTVEEPDGNEDTGNEEESRTTTVGESVDVDPSPGPKNSGAQTVSSHQFDALLHLLRQFAGNSSLHCNRVTYSWQSSSCCP